MDSDEVIFQAETSVIATDESQQQQLQPQQQRVTSSAEESNAATVTNNDTTYDDFSDFSSDEISDCGDDNDDVYEERSSQLAHPPDEEEYDDYYMSEEGSDPVDNELDSDDEEFVIGSRKPKKRTATKVVKKPKPPTTTTKRSISSAFGKTRRPSIKFKKKKKSSAYGEVDYGDTTTEEELYSEEEYDENDYFYKYEPVASDDENVTSGETNNATSKKFDINQFGLETKYNEVVYANANKFVIEKILNYKFGPSSLIGTKIYRHHVMELEDNDNRDDNPIAALKSEPTENDVAIEVAPTASADEKSPTNEIDNHYVMQFLIKWKDKSYLHSSWESEQSLADLGVTNTKKLQNFCQDNDIDPACTIDPVSLMNEHSQSMINDKNQAIDDVLEEFTKLDCILAITPSTVSLEQYSLYESTGEINLDELLSEGVHFLCHWNNLPYSDATWEDASFVHKLFPNSVKEYFVKKSKMYYQLDLRRMGNLKFYKVDSTPDFIAHCNCDESTKVEQDVNAEDVKMEEVNMDNVNEENVDVTVENEQPNDVKVTDSNTTVQKIEKPLHTTCNILRDYQLEGINWMTSSFCRKKSVILADEMGLGKTVQVISFISTLYHTYHINGPYLIVVPLSTVESWKTHFHKWAPELTVIGYTGNAESRKVMRRYNMFDNDGDDNQDLFEKIRTDQAAAAAEMASSQEFNIYNYQLKFHVFVTTYEMIIKDKEFIGQFDWVSLVVDEAHRLKNVESSLYTTLQSFYSSHRLLMTGTPLQNNLRELWSILHFILPDRYPSWEDFEMNFSQVDPKSGYMKLQKEISPYILRRMKKDVEKSLPPKIEQILRVEMTKKQKDLYKCILTKNYTQLSKELKCNVTGFLNVMMELKKCCNHTSLITHMDLADCTLQDILRGGGKLILLDKLLERFKKDGSRVLIFSQMIMILDILSTYLTLKGYSFQRLDGSVGEAKRKQAMNEFNAVGSENFCFLLSTRAGGLGINLVSADVVIIFDSDWNPQNDLQAQARAHRIGQTKTVKIYRLVTKGSVDETIVERAKKKMVLDHLVIQTMSGVGGSIMGGGSTTKSNSMSSNLDKKDLSSIIKFGAEELFKEEDEDNDDKLEEMDIDQILLLAEEHDSDQLNSNAASLNNGNNVGEELLSSFKVANFKTSDFDMGEEEGSESEVDLKWDDIIPENERRRILDEEETARMAQLYLPPRRRSTVPLIDPLAASASRGTGTKKSTSKSSKKQSHSKYGNEANNTDDDDVYVDSSDDKKPTASSRKKGKLSQFVNQFNGLTGQDVKKFVSSYKKFPSAWERCEVVARDASLSNKPIKQVQQLAKWLHGILPKANPKSSSKSKQARSNKLTINEVQISSSELYEWEQLTKSISQHIKSHVVDKSADFANVKIVNVTLEFFRELYPSIGACFRYCKFPKFSIQNRVSWKPKHDAELIVGVFFKGFGNWKEMFDDNLLTLFKESDMTTSVISKKMKSRLNDLVDVLSKTKFSSDVIDNSDYENEAGDDDDNVVDLASDDDAAFETVKKSTKTKKATTPSKKKHDKATVTQSPKSPKSSPKEIENHKTSKSSKSKKSTSSANPDDEKSSSSGKRSGGSVKSSKKQTGTNLITQYMKSSKSDSQKTTTATTTTTTTTTTSGGSNSASSEKEKITEITLTDKMVDCCGSMLKPVKESISKLESIFKGRIYDEVANSADFKACVDAIGMCIDSSYDKDKSTSKKSKIFKNIHHMKCAMWNFVSRFTNATPLELYGFYHESKSN